MFKHKLFSGFMVLVLSIFLSGCGNEEEHSTENHAKQVHVAGDIREETAAKEQLPTFLNEFQPQIQAVYANVPEHHDLLQYIPCYCGCGESVNHKSNLECFIHEMKPDGTMVWDSHGTTCNACLAIATESMSMHNDGKSYKEIRDTIDQKYKEGFAKPTDTPMPPSGK